MIAAAGKGGAGGSAGSLAAVDQGNPDFGSKGGCGCRAAGEDGSPVGLAGLGIGLAVLARRRRKQG
jgi:MYXO-CTERM domain-containing protein